MKRSSSSTFRRRLHANLSLARLRLNRCVSGAISLSKLHRRTPLAHQLLSETRQLLRTFQVIVFDQACALALAQLQKKHRRHKRYTDLMIAAMAMAGDHVVVTRNTRHFADVLPTARLANWIDDPPR